MENKTSSKKRPTLKTFEFNSPNQEITLINHVFVFLDPETKQLQVGTIKMTYFPKKNRAVSKQSILENLSSYRNVEISQEEITKLVFDDLSGVLDHSYVEIQTKFQILGGMFVECIETGAEFLNELDDE